MNISRPLLVGKVEKNMIQTFLLLLILFTTASAFANPLEPSNSSYWKFDNYIDGSYNHMLRSNKFTSGTYNRVYDLNQNGLTLQQASLSLSYEPEDGFGGLINPILGHDTFIFSPYGWDPSIGIQQAGFDIPQGYLEYKHNLLTIIGGAFNTLAGAEYMDPTKDFNFSRSILWGYTQPTTHLGLRSTYAVNEQLNVFTGINNGWDSIRDTSRRKTLELGLTYAPMSTVLLSAIVYSGGQRPADQTDFGPISIRNLVDIVVTIKASDKLTLIANCDYGTQPLAALPDDRYGKAVWQGIAGYLNYQFREKWRTSVRGEIFDDSNGYRTGIVQLWEEATLTIGYQLLNNFELRAEARHDFSNVNSFLNANHKANSNNQQSFAIEGVAKFL